MISVAVIALVGILNLTLGLSALIKTKRQTSAFYYFLITIITVLWILPLGLLEYATTDGYHMLFARFAFIGPTFLPLALYGFISNFPRSSKKEHDPLLLFFAAMGLVFLSVALLGSNFITGFRESSAGIEFDYGYQYTVYFVYLAGGIFYLLGWMYMKYRKAQGLDQLRLKYLLTGFVLSAAGALVTNMLLPMLGMDTVSSFGPVSTLFLFYFTTQAIIYHRLFDIGTFVANLVEVFLLAGLFYGIIFLIRTVEIKILHLSFYDPVNIFIDLVFAFTVASNIRVFLKIIARFVGRLLITEKIQVEEIAKEIDELRGDPLSLSNYMDKLASILNTHIPKLRATITNNEHTIIELDTFKFGVAKMYLAQELGDATKQRKYLQQRGYGMVLRLSPSIALLLSEKAGQYAYTKQEIEAISYLGQRLQVALTERSLLESTNNFNAILQKKVDQQTKKLTHANEKLKELDKAKSDFISMASHQLRTPISVIRGYLSMILAGDLGKVNDNISPSLLRVLKNTDQLNNIVEDILNASRIEQSRLVINKASGDISELTRTAVQELTQKAKQKGVTLESNIPNKKITAPFDQTKVYEAILNLIDNALSYTKQGSVSVFVSETSDNVTVKVKDTGIGIPDNKKEYIFKRFSRLENAKQVRPDGTGIGLFIAKKIIDAHRGKIWFESKLNVGTTFFLQLPKK